MQKWVLRITVALALVVAVYIVAQDKQQEKEWVETRQVITIRVAPNQTLWQIAEEHKPNFMDVREYIYEVEQLNNMQDAYLYAGDELYIYTY